MHSAPRGCRPAAPAHRSRNRGTRGRALEGSRYSLAAIRRICAALPAPGERTVVLALESPRRAALLVPLVALGAEAAVVVTRRASSLERHADDWMFPGGGLDASDASAAAGAIREASEELGLPRSDFEILGQLDSRGPILSGHRIEVFVACATPSAGWRPAAGEVEEIRARPLRHFADPANAYRARMDPGYEIGPVAAGRAAGFPPELLHLRIGGGAILWGMQAEILAELLVHVDPDGARHLLEQGSPCRAR